MTVFNKVMSDSQKCQNYVYINRNVGTNVFIGQEILAFVKNYRFDIIYCSLNLGMGITGIIKDQKSLQILRQYN